jgi:hypothetical protein
MRVAALAGMISLAAGPAVTLRHDPMPDMDGSFLPRRRSRSTTTKRGKHKKPRHGQKPKSCRAKIGRRVRRKHRRAR